MSGNTIEQLQQRYGKFKEQQIRVQAQLEGAQKQLAELQQKAREQFGTDDVEALEKKLQAMKQENERKRAEYEKGLDAIESRLAEVENDLSDSSVDE